MTMKIRYILLATLVIITVTLPVFAQEPSPKDTGGEPSPVATTKPQCADGIDNDKDGGIDLGKAGWGGYGPDTDCQKEGALCEDGTSACTIKNTPPASGVSDFELQVRINNPLKVDTIDEAIKLFMSAVLRIALPFIVVFFIWSGFSFVLARGNPEKVKTAKNMFWYTIIGTLLILGAWVITNAIIGTVNSITG